jgi:hypothetical protein
LSDHCFLGLLFIGEKSMIMYPDTAGLRSAARRIAPGLQERLQVAASLGVYKMKLT